MPDAFLPGDGLCVRRMLTTVLPHEPDAHFMNTGSIYFGITPSFQQEKAQHQTCGDPQSERELPGRVRRRPPARGYRLESAAGCAPRPGRPCQRFDAEQQYYSVCPHRTTRCNLYLEVHLGLEYLTQRVRKIPQITSYFARNAARSPRR